MGHQLERLTHCLNCEQPTQGNFCSNCGQENEDQTASIKAVLEDFLDDIIHFDSRLVRTALPLVFKPGFLTVEYNRGRRVNYLSPYRMYLFVSAVFFLLLAYTGVNLTRTHAVTISDSRSTGSVSKESTPEDQKTKAQVLATLKKAGITVNPNGSVNGHPGVNVNVSSENLGDFINQSVDEAGSKTSTDDADSDDDDVSSKLSSNVHIFGKKLDLSHLPASVNLYDSSQAKLPVPDRDPVWIQNVKRNLITFKSDPSSLQDRLLDLIPKMTFFLVPLYAASLYPMYLRKKKYYVEHLIYSLHTHSFVFVVFTIIMLLDLPAVHRSSVHHLADIGIFLMLLSVPVYLFAAMLRVYQESFWKTALKSFIAWSNYWVLLTMAFLVTIAYAFLMQ